MIDFKKYKRFFAFGCSMTSYFWPTWADIISQEIPESYNYGQSGGGNLFIASQVVEASIRHKFTETDLIIIMWSGISREDRWCKGSWLTPGNIFTQSYYDFNFIRKFSDCKGYLIRDLSLIQMCDGYLESLNLNYYMLNMAPFDNIQFDDDESKFEDYENIIIFYNKLLKKIKPDLLTVGCSGVWPQHPIVYRLNKGQTADYHPDTLTHSIYLKKIFPDIKFSENTLKFIDTYQHHIHNNRYLEDLRQFWNPKTPKRF